MSAASDDDGRFHLELRPGWRQMLLAPIDGEVWDEEVLAALEWCVGQVLRPHHHSCRRWGQSLLVSVGPPHAPHVLHRLEKILTRCLGATHSEDEEELVERA